MASFDEIKGELAAILSGVVALKTQIANLPPPGAITQAQLDALDSAADDILVALGAAPAPVDQV